MNNTEFTYLLQNPQEVTASQTEALKTILDTFPYCQSARALYLKGLKNKESFNYNQELKTTASYTTDRSILFDFITSEKFLQNEISKNIKQNTEHLKDIPVDVEDISVNKKVTLDDRLKQQIEETTGVLDPDLFEPKTKTSKVEEVKEVEENAQSDIEEQPKEVPSQETKQEKDSPDKILNIGKPLQFGQNETHSFNEWLKLASYTPIEREEKPKPKKKTKSEKEKKFDLIEKFISKNPKLKPTKTATKNNNIAEERMIQPESLMTETLARIYVEQKNYKKAIQSYKILILKYPEKSGFFADQIYAIKQLQEQNNKE
ncbi:tetratricopeptide repeat protein [Oceanihabitans sediminis]|uniref:Tetratricopeptide repeat protein n=1 Tax=Oceanihabitans sediminis TaxID=1812012 RepID=A0A368P9M8_9FLAO|nr:tetratricopeptide repeat protein [Oceanihabitans sediminis]MDX1278372.1 tetratricopeptide repeat protein [Oceanihabitans sediminis]MDX1772584.1 tetratricopeptide repeat protein [Oceanihabitans sediminis]RBP34251.1 hypothetical protein DFR65_101135 [Oceanihabitans sediminis]RCU57941.1 hypothetical protein DU428_00685 [Oceanihabitans sediminis]